MYSSCRAQDLLPIQSHFNCRGSSRGGSSGGALGTHRGSPGSARPGEGPGGERLPGRPCGGKGNAGGRQGAWQMGQRGRAAEVAEGEELPLSGGVLLCRLLQVAGLHLAQWQGEILRCPCHCFSLAQHGAACCRTPNIPGKPARVGKPVMRLHRLHARLHAASAACTRSCMARCMHRLHSPRALIAVHV